MENLLTLLKKVPSKYYINFGIIAIIFLVIWFVFPHITLGGGKPFSSISVRTLILGLIAAVYALKQFITFLQQHKKNTWETVYNTVKNIGQHLQSGSQSAWQYGRYHFNTLKDKVKQDRTRRRLRRLPWYLVLGTKQSGKKSLIMNSGFYFQRPEIFGDEAVNYINNIPDFEWWFSEQAVFIDAMTYDKDTDNTSWKRFIRLLKRERKNKPLNGIVLTLSLSDIIQYTNQTRQDFLQDVAKYIRDIHKIFKSFVPVYVVFNKTDLVEGFLEFFGDLSKEELRQVWGMTLPIDNCNDLQFIKSFYSTQYNELLKQLSKRVIWALDTETTRRGRELINAFPQQMKLFKRPIDDFLMELYGATRYHNALMLRGIYFTSSTQEYGEPQDFYLQAMSKKFQLMPPKFEQLPHPGECYFISDLFHNVMLHEAHLLGDSERSKKIKRLAYRSAITACPLLVLLGTVGMYYGYQENSANLKQIDQHINFYYQDMASLKQGDRSLLPTLPALNQLNSANNLYNNNQNWGINFLPVSHIIHRNINAALQRSLSSNFLPRVAAQIEDSLNHNIADQNLLYATLKAYLAFSSTNNISRYNINTPMEYQWNRNYINQPNFSAKLRYYLNLSLRNSVQKLPLDNQLINQIRGELEEVVPSDRAYGLLSLHAGVSNTPALMIPSAIGSNFYTVFTVDNRKQTTLPALYTQNGYTHVFLKEYKKIASEVAQDNQDIGLVNNSSTQQNADQIDTIMRQTYNKNYLAHWKAALSNIHIKKFTSLKEAINALNTLTGSQSPLKKLLMIINNNTGSIHNTNINVSQYYNTVNRYERNTLSGASWSETLKALKQIKQYFIQLEKTPDQAQSSFLEAEKTIQGKSSPIEALSSEANKAPEPIKRWLQTLAQQSWQIIIQGAHAKMNAAWQNQVMSLYNTNLKDRYPLNPKAYSQVSIKSFNQFFKKGGILEVYFNQYIKPFINTDKKTWKLYAVNHLNIELSQHIIDLFRRAQFINHNFYAQNPKQASLNFSIKPLALDSNASSSEFTAGEKRISYSHGPQNEVSISWPTPFNAENAALQITGFNGAQYGHSASGPWALFKIFSHGVLKATANNGTYLFNVNFNGYWAHFRITGINNIHVFKLTYLKNFKLPNNIAPDINNTGEK